MVFGTLLGNFTKMQRDNIKVDLREIGCVLKHNWDAGNKRSVQSSVIT
jgi:hypothetical protein